MANIEKITANFNEVRANNEFKSFTFKEMRKKLGEARTPYQRVDFLVQLGAIKSPKRGEYVFPSTPVHISVMTKYYEMAYKAGDVKKITRDSDDIKKAIDLLLATGEYKILKKAVKWEELK